jgi:hypothetical protein
VICGTRGVPGTVAPFRAWRGSRDLVAQSPKFHVSTVAKFLRLLNKSLAQPRECRKIACARRDCFSNKKYQSEALAALLGSSAGFT